MKVVGLGGVGVGVLVGMVNGIAGWHFGWIASQHFGGVVTGRLIGLSLGSGLQGLQLLATTVISLS
jgi:hypothetical protein